MPSESLTFGQILRSFLTERGLSTATAAELWSVESDTINKHLGERHSVPKTKIRFWSQVLERPEEEIRSAINATRLKLGRAPWVEPASDQADQAERLQIARGAMAAAEAAHADTEVAS